MFWRESSLRQGTACVRGYRKDSDREGGVLSSTADSYVCVFFPLSAKKGRKRKVGVLPLLKRREVVKKKKTQRSRIFLFVVGVEGLL